MGLLLPLLVFHWRVLRQEAIIPWDMPGHHLPLASAFADALREGVLPLWEPYAYCGRPLLANPQVMTFYPPMLACVLPGREGLLYRLEWMGLLHVFFAAWLAFRLARRLGLETAPALLTGLMFELGALPASQAQHLSALCGMPWIVLAWTGLF
ncbi:MAG: hypothetical protein HYZ37_13445, partial [Candidatus Solibacter usitatus]|nr:hypothetical protein [Candidatus Solibacter usitatus]